MLLTKLFHRALTSDYDTPDFLDPGGFEGRGAFIEGSAGSGDIVDEPDIFPDQRSGDCGRHGKGSGQVAQAFFAAFGFPLRPGEADAAEALAIDCDTESGHEAFPELSRDEFGLIETSVAQPPRVERDGDEEVGERERMMGQALFEEIDERQDRFFKRTVFERMDELGDEPETVGPGDEEAIECGLAPASLAGCTIRLIRRFTDRADLGIGLGDEAETGLAGKDPFFPAAEASQREESVEERSERSAYQASGR